MSFGDNLRTLIEERDLTQKELAAKLNIAPSTMGSYVQNTREPDFATLKAIAKFFNVSIDYLLDNHTGKTANHKEDELLRIFRSSERLIMRNPALFCPMRNSTSSIAAAFL